VAEFTQTILLDFLSIWEHLGGSILSLEYMTCSLQKQYHKGMSNSLLPFLYIRLHGVCEENPLAPIIGRLGLPLYRTSGDDSVLFDHDLER
jgi:hypothetical protein